MKASDFSKNAPGELISTTGHDRVVRDGVPATIPVKGRAFVPDSLPPKIDWQRVLGSLTTPLIDAERQVARLDGVASRLADASLVARPLRLREATLSSRIENTIATVEEVSLVEANQPPPRHEVVEVLNCDLALEHGLNSRLPICIRLICEMHRILLKDARGENKQPGQIRDVQNYIGNDMRGFAGARFVPPPPREPLRTCLRDYELFVNGRRDPPLPELIQIALAHYQFEAIHPFRDGNGRIGRLLIALSMCRMGLISRPLLYVSGYFEENRRHYYDLMLRVSQAGEWEPWLRYFLEAVASQAADARRRAEKLLALRERYVERVTGPRASALLISLIDLMFRRPHVTASQAAEMLKISIPPAQKHINTLVKHGILKEVTGGKYGRVYGAREILRAIAPDSSNPPEPDVDPPAP